jgi:ankyrin repeat protein
LHFAHYFFFAFSIFTLLQNLSQSKTLAFTTMPNKKGKRKAKAAAARQRGAAEINEALLNALDNADVMSARAAIAAGANVNYSRNSCLMQASFRGHAEMVSLWLNAGADKDARAERGATALMAAAQNGHAHCSQLLLNAGADKEAKQLDGFTALLAAAQNGHANCIKLLLKNGADKEAKQISGATPLLMAAQKGHADCVKLLLNAGADKNATNAKNSTALLLAALHGHLQCIECLLKAGCNVHALNKYGSSALSLAVRNNHVDCVRALVHAEADITIEVHGQTVEDSLKQTNNGDELRAALLSSSAKQRICEECEYATRGKMMKCGACKKTHYCSRDCQMANRPLHKQVCKACE